MSERRTKKMKALNDVAGKRCRCHPKLRQIGRCPEDPVNFKNYFDDEDPDLPPEVARTVFSPSFSLGERILNGVDWATRKIQLLTLLPQLCPLFIIHSPNGNLTLEDTSWKMGMFKTEKSIQHQFLSDLHVLGDYWPHSKKSDDHVAGIWSGNGEDERVVPTLDERDHDKDEKDQGGMSCQSKSHKKSWISLKQDKFRRQFLREVLAQSRSSTSVILAAGTQFPNDVDIDEKKTDNQNLDETGKKLSVVKLLKLGLKSRYSSHLRKSLREKDVQATMCILSIIANTGNEMEMDKYDVKIQSGKENDMKKKADEQEFVHDNGNDDRISRSEDDFKDLTSIPVPQSDPTTGLDNYKMMLTRVFKFLQTNPKTMIGICHVMNRIMVEQSMAKSSENNSTILRPELLEEFQEQMKRLHNYWEKRLRFFEMEEIHSNLKQRKEEQVQFLSTASDHRRRVALSNRIQELKQGLTNMKSKWDNISGGREMEIQMLQIELQNTRDEAAHNLLATVKSLETEYMIQAKAHKQRLEKFDMNADETEKQLTQSVLILDYGYRGLRSYRKNKEAELQRIIWEYNDAIAKQRQTLKGLWREVKENENEVKRLDEVQMGMQETYEEMKTTKRLRELLLNMQMAESVKENWAARRIQTAWKRYKTRKLRKRRLKKPRKKKRQDSGGGIGGVFFGFGNQQPKTVAERRKPAKSKK